jgi:O-antigen ligase
VNPPVLSSPYRASGPPPPAAAISGAASLNGVSSPSASAFVTLGFFLVAVDLFMTVSRFPEIFYIMTGQRIPFIVTALHTLAFIMAIFTGGLLRVSQSRMGVYILLFTFWIFLSTPFSTWKGGSVNTLLYSWLPSLTAFFNAAALITTRKQFRTASIALALSAVVIAVASFKLGTLIDQRLAFSAGTLKNANDLATILLLAMPFLLLFFAENAFAKLLAGGGLALSMVVLLRTGSRGAILALAMIVLIILVALPVRAKIQAMVALALLAIVGLASTPDYILNRFRSAMDDRYGEAVDVASKQARMELLKDSIRVTLENPVVGVGPGRFSGAAAIEAREQGKWARWSETHNTFTQVSSELGIPALIIYVLLVASMFTGLRQVKRIIALSPDPRLQSLSGPRLAVLSSGTGVVVNALFGSNAYVYFLPIVLAMSFALRTIALDTWRQIQLEAQRKAGSGEAAAPAPARSRMMPAFQPAAVAAPPVPADRWGGHPRRSSPGLGRYR